MNEIEITSLNPNCEAVLLDPEHERLYKCPKCDRYFRNVGPLKAHIGKAHRKSDPNFCLIDSSEVCKICNKTFGPRSALIAHYRKTHLNQRQNALPRKLYECEICRRPYTLKSALDKHLQRHRDRSIKESFKCDKCTGIFYNLESFETHCKMHTTTKPNFCERCQSFPYNPSRQCTC